MEAGLQLRGIIAGYGQGDILRGLDLDVPAGQITCLIGPNGSGKSTVLRVISGLLAPRAGQVSLAGKNVTGWSPRALLNNGLAHVPQERSLFPEVRGQHLRLRRPRKLLLNRKASLCSEAF